MRYGKWFSLCALLTLSTLVSSACVRPSDGVSEPPVSASVGEYSVTYDSDDYASPDGEGDEVFVLLREDAITADGPGVALDGSRVVISEAGTYRLQGSFAGQVRVNASGKVTLILDGVSVRSDDGPALYIQAAQKVILSTEEESENLLADTETHSPEDSDDLNAALYCRSDLTLNGGGKLTVEGNYEVGVNCRDDLKITGGALSVTAVDDGIKGKDSVTVSGGAVTVNAGADGIKATKTEDAQRGFVLISGGTVTVTAATDGIQAETRIVVSDGTVSVTSGGGSANASTSPGAGGPGGWGNWGGNGASIDTASAKGLKAAGDLHISGGKLTVDSSDDSLHSNGDILIEGGTLRLSSGDDGVHADNSLTVCDGQIEISKSYEGLEALNLTVSGGVIRLVASDDGLNVAGGNDGSAMGGRPGQNGFASSSGGVLTISGGYIYVNASGDGLDSNGSVVMSGGTVLLDGPANNGNGALDYQTSFSISGGFLLAVGASGMAETPSASSEQYSIQFNVPTVAAGTLLSLTDEDGNRIFCFAPAKNISNVIISSPQLEKGKSYTLSVGGACTGTPVDGLYADGDCSGGTETATVTIHSTVTSTGGNSGFGGGGGGGFNPGGGDHGGGPGGMRPPGGR